MSGFAPKSYQRNALNIVRKFFVNCHNSASASEAFSKTTAEEYNRNWGYRAPKGFETDAPYFCLRVPTGGGKTWIAAKAINIVNKYLLPREHGLILWLTPRDAIGAQTLAGFKTPGHPLRGALSEAGPITVLSLEEALSVSRSTLENSTVVIVASRQAFQVESEEVRRVYRNNGELMAHFRGLPPEVAANLLAMTDENGQEISPRVIPSSLVNVLRMRRPFIVVDEAHNNRTELAFETLAKFLPSGIMELTATPDIEKRPSNVLYSASAAELKNEGMIKLPIILTTTPDAAQCLANAISKRDELQNIADKRRRAGEVRTRPLVLIQAEPRSASRETLHCDAVREELVKNHRVPEEEILVATGDKKGLDALARKYKKGLNDEKCPVKYIITQQALAEGWDCPQAYILVSFANAFSETAVEQLLGRILRQPNATRFEDDALNQAYAYVVSDNFAATANNLRDQLVKIGGFERREAGDFVLPSEPWQPTLAAKEIRVADKESVGPIPASLAQKAEWDGENGTLTLRGRLTSREIGEIGKVIKNQNVLNEIILYSSGMTRREEPKQETPSQRGEKFSAPQLSLVVERDGEIVRELFIDASAQLLEPPNLKERDAAPADDEIRRLTEERGVSTKIDVDARGRLKSEFLRGSQFTLDLLREPENWDATRLAAWLCQNVETPWLRHDLKFDFVRKWIDKLLDKIPLVQAIRKKSIARNLVEARLKKIKTESDASQGQSLLAMPQAAKRFRVDDLFLFEFSPDKYYPKRLYDTVKWGFHDFKKHYYPLIGDFDSSEEFECAQFLDNEALAGRIKFWVRNLANDANSFSLKKISDRFYPDFVCALPDGRVLVVEYKGAHLWNEDKVKADRQIGELWAELSGGRCEFVMVKDKDWGKIERAIRKNEN